MRKFLPLVLLLLLSNFVKSQTFNYTFNSDTPPYSYTLKTTITIVGIKITQLYYDDNKATGSTGSFAYQLIVNYTNTVTGSNIPASSTFYQFQTDASSSQTGPQPAIQNNSSSIPISSGNGVINIGNNPTFTNGSLSAFGYTVGNTYTDAATLNRFGYLTLKLSVNAPGMSAQSSTQNGTVLPVTLSQFIATPANNAVAVKWITAMENNSSYFTVERSLTSINFTALGTVAAHGNSNSIIDYRFIDASPLAGTSYYRLKETDIDGNNTYSSIVLINNTLSTIDKLSFYPTANPTSIVYFSGNTTNKVLDVYSIAGAKVFSTVLSSNQVTLPNLSKGVYLFKITAADNSVQINKYIQQ